MQRCYACHTNLSCCRIAQKDRLQKDVSRVESQGWQSRQSTLGTTTLWAECFCSRSGCLPFFSICPISWNVAEHRQWRQLPPLHHLNHQRMLPNPNRNKNTTCPSDRSCSCRPHLGHLNLLDFQWPHGRAMEAALLEWVNALGVPCFRNGSWDVFVVNVTAKEMKCICAMSDKLRSQTCIKMVMHSCTVTYACKKYKVKIHNGLLTNSADNWHSWHASRRSAHVAAPCFSCELKPKVVPQPVRSIRELANGEILLQVMRDLNPEELFCCCF